MKRFDSEYCIEVFQKLLSTDSTTGYYREIQELVRGMLEKLGCPCRILKKGGIIADLGGEGNAAAITVHLDDIGLMVRHVNADGTLRVAPVGGLFPFCSVMENVRVRTRDDRVYTGSVCRSPGSQHLMEQEQWNEAPDYAKNICVVLDEDVRCAADTESLGITTGDIIALEPRFTQSNGYLKSRFIDDKACAAVLLTFMRMVKKEGLRLNRKVYAYFSVYEETGHGTSWLPDDVCDLLALDIAPTGPEQTSDEHKVSIFAKDTGAPYHWELTGELRGAAIRAGVDYVMDVFTPYFNTDCLTSLHAGHDIRHAAFGPGTANSHGYERTHIKGLQNTFDLLCAYLLEE